MIFQHVLATAPGRAVIYDSGVRITGIDHVNIDTSCPDETIAFYSEVLGLENRPEQRPDFGFPGAWLFLAERAVVHLNFIDDDGRSSATSAFNHIAFEGHDFGGMQALLDRQGLKYQSSERPEIALKQIFVDDPNGVRVEINIRGE